MKIRLFMLVSLAGWLASCDTTISPGSRTKTSNHQKDNYSGHSVPPGDAVPDGVSFTEDDRIDVATFYRENFSVCSTAAPDMRLFAADSYKTVHTSHPLGCDLTRHPKNLEVQIDRAFSADDDCYAHFLRDMDNNPKAAIARWIFALTQSDGSLERPQELAVAPRQLTGITLLDGGNNRGVFTISSPTWRKSITVKLTKNAQEAVLIARNSLLSVVRPECLHAMPHPDAATRRFKIDSVGPWFSTPLASVVYGGQGPSGQHHGVWDGSCDERGCICRDDEGWGGPEGGILLMRTADGAPQQRQVSVHDAGFGESLEGARIEGASLALFQLSQLQASEDPNIFHQSIWCHGDLHYGNVIVDPMGGTVHYLDFERMHPCTDWFHEVRRQIIDSQPVHLQLRAIVDIQNVPAQQCLTTLEGWTADSRAMATFGQLDPFWLGAQLRFVAFARAYLTFAPPFARAGLEEAFDHACRESLKGGHNLSF